MGGLSNKYDLMQHMQNSVQQHMVGISQPPKATPIEFSVRGYLQNHVSKWLKGVELPLH